MTLSPVRRFWRLLEKYRSEIRVIYAYALLIGIVNLTLPLGIQAIVSFLQTGELTSTWIILVGFVLMGIGVAGWLQVLQLRIVENMQQDLFARSAFEFAYRLPKISLLQLDRIHTPELVNRFFDTLTLQKGLPKILLDFSLAAFQIIFGMILLTIYSPYFLLMGVTLGLLLWLVFRVTGPKGLSTSLKESKHKYRMAHWLEEIGRLNRSFKVYPVEPFHLQRTDDIAGDYLKAREQHFGVLLGQFRWIVAFKVLVAASLLLLGGYLVFKEMMNIGQFVAAEIVILLMISSLEKMLHVVDSIYDILTALDKIGYVTDLELDRKSGSKTLSADKGLGVEAKEIVFGFPGERRKVVNGLSFEIAPNERVVLRGPSGSGKSVLLRLMAGMHEPEEGELYINGAPLSHFQRNMYYENMGISLPINQIFDGSFRDNIVLGRHIDDGILDETLRILKLDEFMIHQPNGLDCPVDSGGRRLPRAIIQKILLARLLVNQPRLLLMEEPLEHVEKSEKRNIISHIMDRKHPWTVVVVSQDEYWREMSDRTIELSKN